MRRMLASCFSLAVLGLGLMPGVSKAGLSISLGNPANLVQNNVGSFVATSSTTAEGSLLGNGPNVLEVETNVALTIGGAGSASIIAAGTGFTSFEITPTAGFLGFTGLAINLDDVNGPVGNVTYTIQAYDQFGLADTETNVPLENGNNNRSYVLPLDSLQYITRLVVTASGPGIDSIQNIQINAAVVPEPATLASAGLGGLLLAGYGLRRRSRKVA